MTTSVAWPEVDARWPGASVLWDRDLGGEVEPNLVVVAETLWNLCRDHEPVCCCMAWNGVRWVRWAELWARPHPAESGEQRLAAVARCSGATAVIEQLADLPEYTTWLQARDGLPFGHSLARAAAEAFRDLGFDDAWCERVYNARKATRGAR